jgi:DNA-binding transcriptional ArsR family regulator
MKFSELTAEQVEKSANMLKAIAHPIRIAILSHLDEDKQLSVKEIHKLMGIEQSAASHHLGILKDRGILLSRREGKNIYYYIKDKNISCIVDCIGQCACN